MSGGALDTALARNTSRPIYQQIKDAIIAKIRAGEWLPGEKLPSENALVEELGVSRMTVSRALRELAQHGHLERVHGVGTFIAEPMRHASLLQIRNIAEEIRASGRTHRADLRLLREERATRFVARRMQLTPGASVFHAVLVHYQDEEPIQIEDRHVNPAVAPAFMQAGFPAITPTEYLVNLFRPDEMEHVVQATLPNREACRRLGIDATEPCLRLLRRTWKDGHVVTTVSMLYPGSRYDLVARYATDDYRAPAPTRNPTERHQP